MGCNCGGSRSSNPPLRHISRPPNSNTPTTNIIQRNGSQQQGPDPKNFCRICGWLLKKSRYIDVKSNAVVERVQCTNQKCSTNR